MKRADKQSIINKIKELHPDLVFNIDAYKNESQILIVKTKYGKTRTNIRSLLLGYKPDIRTSLDKNQYFRNICLEKFGEDEINDLSQIDYTGTKNKIKIIDRDYGEYWILPSAFLKGARSSRRANKAIGDALRSDKQDIINRIKTLHPDIDFELTEYVRQHQKIIIKDKYGECQTTVKRLLDGLKPGIPAALNKTEYYINQVKEVHGDKYDYSLVEYKSYYGIITIIGPNGTFKMRAGAHLKGSGCSIEARKRVNQYHKDNPVGWSYTVWAAAAKKSRSFSGLFKVYFLECWDEETQERFYKIGRTYVDIKTRFRSGNMPYSYNILYTIELEDARRICELEQEYKNKHKEFKHIPTKKFRGMHECFSSLNIDLQTY